MAGLARMIEAAGFRLTDKPRRFRMPPAPGTPPVPFSPGLLRTAGGREAFVRTRFGDPHAVVHARVA